MLGVATLIIVMSVMNGFREELLSRILGLNGHVEVMATQGALRQYDDVAQRLRSVDGVIRAIPVVEGQEMVTAHTPAVGGLVRGLRAEELKRRPIPAHTILTGPIYNFHHTDAIMTARRSA